MLDRVQVCHHNDLDKHSVLCIDLRVPQTNPQVWKWKMPRKLVEVEPDLQVLRMEAEEGAMALRGEIQSLVNAGNMDGALREWAQSFEMMVLKASGVPQGRWGSYQGRCSSLSPVKVRVGPARLRVGRAGDFRPGLYQSNLKVRQWTKQVRRMQNLERLMKAVTRQNNRVSGSGLERLWRAIVGAQGFPGGFLSFLVAQSFFVPSAFPAEGWVREIRVWLQDQVQSIVRQAAKDGRRLFIGALEDSWQNKGGALPCRLIRDQQMPKLEELRLQRPMQLAPQRWMPDGLAWVKYKDVSFLSVGDVLQGEIEVEIRDIVDNRVQLSKRVSRRQAANLIWRKVSTDPVEWCHEVLEGWNQYWRRDADESIPESAVRHIERIQEHEPLIVKPLRVEDWNKALKRTKVHTMVGVDGFCAEDLQLIPEATLEGLLDIFRAIENGAEWPQLCKQWLVVLLRKEQMGLLTWDVVRPISVAGLLYRTWAKTRTMVMMRHACKLASPTVSPVLSTRSIWGLELDLLDSHVREGVAASGCVLDITKAFNVLHRGMLKAIMLRYGFPPMVVAAWFEALKGMRRQVLVNGAVYGTSTATTGVPEGDPLSVVAMFSVAACFRDFVQEVDDRVLPITFADNWEVFATKLSALEKVMRALPLFLDDMLLPVNPAKCWFWSISASVRKRLKTWQWKGDKVPVLLSAKVLGADVSYSFRRAARVRNGRIRAGHRRMMKIAGLPMGRSKKVMLLFKSAFPQSLHAAESTALPRTTAKRLRAKAVKAVGLSASGVSPWLAAAVGTHAVFDPEWVVLMSRVRLYRQLVRDFPERRQLFLSCLRATRGRYVGSTRLLVRALEKLGWKMKEDEVFEDVIGRSFHLVLSTLSHVESLLLTSWADRVVQEVCHRKGLEVLDSLDIRASRPAAALTGGEKGMLAALVTGRHFTGDAAAHFRDDGLNVCPFCKGEDSREHRIYECEGLAKERTIDPLVTRALEEVPREVALYGLWPELQGLRGWQAELDALSMGMPQRRVSEEPVLMFTDGSCLFPRIAELRWASYACVRWSGENFMIVDCGTLPGSQQTIQRAEVWAGVRAIAAYDKVSVFSDSKYFVTIARRLIDKKSRGLPFACPKANGDLWTIFWLALQGCEEIQVEWVPAHVDPDTVSGIARFVALGNGCADAAARGFLHKAFSFVRSYRVVYDSYAWRTRWKAVVQDFHLRLAWRALEVDHGGGPAKEAFEFNPGIADCEWKPEPCLPLDHGFHVGFLRCLLQWLQGLEWAVSTADGLLVDVSWLELFWQWIFDTENLPPVLVSGKWLTLGEDPEVICCLPDVAVLLGTWKKGVNALRGCGLLPEWGVVACTGAGIALGAREGLAGLVGRVGLSVGVCDDLRSQFLRTSRVSGFRLPSFWHL